MEFRFRLACSVIKEKVEARSGFVLRGGTSVRCNEKLIPQFILLITLPRRGVDGRNFIMRMLKRLELISNFYKIRILGMDMPRNMAEISRRRRLLY